MPPRAADAPPTPARRVQLAVPDDAHPDLPRRPTRRRTGVYRRRRAVALLFVVVVVATVLVLAFVGGRATADGESGREVRPAAVYVVRPGDTLWDIAVRLAPHRDPRVVTAALERSAGGTTIRAGQRIVLPASLQG
jgi:Tfp pilus assembly protein FimV